MVAYFDKKQRFLCHSCNKKFFDKTKIVNNGCFISNQVKYAIALELKNKISEKDISKRYRVSPNTVEKIIDSYYDTQKLIKTTYLKFYHLVNLNQLNQLKEP